jgi:hypothetical protein
MIFAFLISRLQTSQSETLGHYWLTVVIDTNVLFQCLPLAELDWASLGPAGVRILIPAAVLKEIDNAKSSGSTRRAKRAREISTMFSKALDADQDGLPLKPGSASRWEFGSGRLASHEDLDPSMSDHRVIAEALDLSRAEPELLLLTGDTLARVLAKRVGVRVRAVPESWLLPPETDSRDKRIRDLEQKVAALEKTTPTMEVSAEQGDAPVQSAAFSFTYYRPPSDAEVEELMAKVRARHPLGQPVNPDLAILPKATLGMSRKIPTARDYEKYRDVTFPKWLARVQKYLKAVPHLWSLDRRVKSLRLRLQNTGSVPADGLLFEYEIYGGGRLLPDDEEDRSKLLHVHGLPPAPKAPAIEEFNPLWPPGSEPLIHDGFAPSLFEGVRGNRDPYTLYEREHPKEPATRHSFECEEFRHGTSVVFNLFLLLPTGEQSDGKLVCRISARNMHPLEWSVGITHRAEEMDSLERLNELVAPPRITLRLQE